MNTSCYRKLDEDTAFDVAWLSRDVHVGIIEHGGVSSISIHWTRPMENEAAQRNIWAWVGNLGKGQTPGVVFPHETLPAEAIDRRHATLEPRNDPYNRQSPPCNEEGSLSLGWGFFTVSKLGDIGRKIQVDIPNYSGHLEIRLYRESLLAPTATWFPNRHQYLPTLNLE